MFVANATNQLVYNPADDRLIAYNLDEHLYSFFSFDTGTWSHTSPSVFN
ncbi:hypothetical protein [Parabacteroides pacaensis]|nr:hypothetical protein [Parabacteroides pacaensis]